MKGITTESCVSVLAAGGIGLKSTLGEVSAFPLPMVEVSFSQVQSVTWDLLLAAAAPHSLRSSSMCLPLHLNSTFAVRDIKGWALSYKEVLSESNLHSHYSSLFRIWKPHIKLGGEGRWFVVWVFPWFYWLPSKEVLDITLRKKKTLR